MSTKAIPLYSLLILSFFLNSCSQGSEQSSSLGEVKMIDSHNDQSLKIYGRRDLAPNGDTIYHTISDYHFINQDSQQVNRATFEGKIYVSDFFFTSCPTICPTMTKQLLRVHDAFKTSPDILLLSHSIDYRADSVPVLKAYADRLEVQSDKWHFVTGKREDIYHTAKTKYYLSAQEDEAAPGGYLHNGKFVLVDRQGRIRGIYTGTEKESVDQLIKDIHLLLKE